MRTVSALGIAIGGLLLSGGVAMADETVIEHHKSESHSATVESVPAAPVVRERTVEQVPGTAVEHRSETVTKGNDDDNDNESETEIEYKKKTEKDD